MGLELDPYRTLYVEENPFSNRSRPLWSEPDGLITQEPAMFSLETEWHLQEVCPYTHLTDCEKSFSVFH